VTVRSCLGRHTAPVSFSEVSEQWRTNRVLPWKACAILQMTSSMASRRGRAGGVLPGSSGIPIHGFIHPTDKPSLSKSTVCSTRGGPQRGIS